MNLYLWSTFSSRSCEPFMNNDVTIDLFVIKPICSLVLQYIRLLFVYIQLNKNALKRYVVPLFLQPKYSLTLNYHGTPLRLHEKFQQGFLPPPRIIISPHSTAPSWPFVVSWTADMCKWTPNLFLINWSFEVWETFLSGYVPFIRTV